jgi:hypothetical protein
MKKLLLQLDSDKFASSFDCITAYDAGVDHVLSYGNVTVEDVRNQVYGAMFTRGGDDLKNSAVFIGGSSVPVGEAMLKAVQDAFFGPVRVSVMADPNGSNTTAAAAVLKISRGAGSRQARDPGRHWPGRCARGDIARQGRLPGRPHLAHPEPRPGCLPRDPRSLQPGHYASRG